MTCMTGKWEESGRTTDKILGSTKGIWILLCCRLHQEAYAGAAGDASPVNPPNSTWMPLMLCTFHPHTHLSHGPALSMLLTMMTASYGRQLVSILRKMAQICRPERDHKLDLQLCLWKAKERLSTPGPVCCKIERRHTIVTILPQKRTRSIKLTCLQKV